MKFSIQVILPCLAISSLLQLSFVVPINGKQEGYDMRAAEEVENRSVLKCPEGYYPDYEFAKFVARIFNVPLSKEILKAGVCYKPHLFDRSLKNRIAGKGKSDEVNGMRSDGEKDVLYDMRAEEGKSDILYDERSDSDKIKKILHRLS